MTLDEYEGWQILDEIPEGWAIDRTAGSPLSGCVFVTDRKSVLRGQKRALLRVVKPQRELSLEESSRKGELRAESAAHEKHPPATDPGFARAANDLARERFKLRMLADILFDLQVCDIEGWSKAEYIGELHKLISGIAGGTRHAPAAMAPGAGGGGR